MRRLITRILTASLGASAIALAVLACSQDGRAATTDAPRAVAVASSSPLFREAAANAPGPEASVPVQTSLAPLIDRLRATVVNISTTTVTKHPRMDPHQRGRSGQGQGQGGPGGQEFEDFFERYFGR